MSKDFCDIVTSSTTMPTNENSQKPLGMFFNMEAWYVIINHRMKLFVLDQSSNHASLPPDALKAFEMNKSDRGKQCIQGDTIIPMTNPDPSVRGLPQKMTLADGTPKGLQTVLTERGFKVDKMKAKCSPVCPFESQNCCMARLLSQQDDFVNQESMIASLIKREGHLVIFLPKFHCELNPIEMVSDLYMWLKCAVDCIICSIVVGVSIATGRLPKTASQRQRKWHRNFLMPVQLKFCDDSSTVRGVS